MSRHRAAPTSCPKCFAAFGPNEEIARRAHIAACKPRSALPPIRYSDTTMQVDGAVLAEVEHLLPVPRPLVEALGQAGADDLWRDVTLYTAAFSEHRVGQEREAWHEELAQSHDDGECSYCADSEDAVDDAREAVREALTAIDNVATIDEARETLRGLLTELG